MLPFLPAFHIPHFTIKLVSGLFRNSFSIVGSLGINTMQPGIDKLSTLPDDILCIILSAIPVKEAIRTSLLSKRWRFVYTQMPQLILSPLLLLHPLDPVYPNPLNIATVENIISKILLLRSSDLKTFHLSDDISDSFHINANYQWRFNRDSIHKWVRYLSWRNVQHLTLCDSTERETPPPALFSCTSLITLKLRRYNLSHLPTHFSGFNHLTTCTLTRVELTNHTLAYLISHCPLLQDLTLADCLGLPQQLSINSPNITDLTVHEGVEALTVNCPKLSTLGAYMIKDLRVNGILFQELSFSILRLNMQYGNNLTLLEMEYGNNFSVDRLIEIMGSFKSLKELAISVGPLLKSEKNRNMCLLNLLFERLPNLQRLFMGDNFISELAEYSIPGRLRSPLSHLRTIQVYVDITEIHEKMMKEISVLGCFLQSTPALEMMDVHLTDVFDYDNPRYTKFSEEVMHLNRVSKQAKILV